MKHFLLLLILCSTYYVFAQQVSDTSYNPVITDPAYSSNAGPTILVDAGHQNFHTAEGRYEPFAKLLKRDGYKVASHYGAFRAGTLDQAKILVISNAIGAEDVNHWHKPNHSAFSKEEIDYLVQWVKRGGSLFLIADHMPMGKAAQDLAKAFGFGFTDGFAIDTTQRGPSIFTLESGNLNETIITSGRNSTEQINHIATFTGQAFEIPEDATSILDLDDRFVNLLPDSAWVFHDKTPHMSATGWSQGAFKIFGQGRIAFFGEAAMFSAQLGGPQQSKMGMNHPKALQNFQLLLNIIHWLDRLY